MKNNNKKATQTLDGESGKTSNQKKQYNILRHLINGISLNRFDAEQIGDHCLPSTISDFCNKKGLSISRKRERVPNGFGGMTSVSRYWLNSEQKQPAQELIRELKQ